MELLGANIRSLRMAYGETQEQLGVALHVEKNTVSYYENGKREPSKETIRAIARHYMVSVEELLHSDLTDIDPIIVNEHSLWKNIRIIFPLISSEKAMQNDNFKKAYQIHKELLRNLQLENFDYLNSLDLDLLEPYLDATDDENAEAEASANCLALWYMLMYSLKMVPALIQNPPAALRQLAKRDYDARAILENPDPNFGAEANEVLNDLNNDEDIKETILEMLTAVKQSKEWSDLADYYLALQYVINIVDNELDWGFNQRIGVEMLRSFSSLNNKYAFRFLKWSLSSFSPQSSQSVDDK